jgi:hypothetical protein
LAVSDGGIERRNCPTALSGGILGGGEPGPAGFFGFAWPG